MRKFDLRPKSVTAALVGLHSRTAVFRVQRQLNAHAGEPLTAILPGATLQQLWDLVGIAERALLAVSALVVVVGLAGMVAVVLASLGERRRELAILRALGAASARSSPCSRSRASCSPSPASRSGSGCCMVRAPRLRPGSSRSMACS